MSAVAEDRQRQTDGGVPARRAIIRWSWRMLTRERRQHGLIVSLIAVVVAATVVIGAAAHHVAPAAGRAEFGDADNALLLDDVDPAMLAATVRAAAAAFGAVDPIGHRAVPVPGTVDQVDYRSQDLDGPYGGPTIAIVDGRAPARVGEAAITDWVARTLTIGIGDEIDLDGTARTVVGIVENPMDLADEFVALPPAELTSSDSFALLVRGGEREFRAYEPPGTGPRMVDSRSDVPEDVLAGVLTLVASTVLMLLVALVAAASFTMIGQRRLPQLGMLSAVGATQRHVRLVMVADGAAAGLVAAVVGVAIGAGVWLMVAGPMEGIVGFRIDPTDVPWWLVGAAMAIAVVAATGAAWWPARTMSRLPTVAALSGRAPRPTATRRSALGAVLLAGVGTFVLRIGSDFGSRGPSATEQTALVIGTLLMVAGLLLAGPVLVRRLGTLARWTPVAARLALRDVSRYQSRSGAALAAIGLALGIPSAIAISTAAAEAQAGIANLPPSHLLVRPDELDVILQAPEAERAQEIGAGVREIIGALGDAAAVPLTVVRDPGAPSEGFGVTPTLDVVRRDGSRWEHIANVYVGAPELLTALGLDRDVLGGSDDVMTTIDGELYLFGTPGDAVPERGQGRRLGSTGGLPPTYGSLPGALASPEVIASHGWETVDAGRWLIEADEPLTADQLRVARTIAAQHGFAIESHDDGDDWSSIRLASGLIGMLLALGVLATTVGLMRVEAAGEIRTLTAAGATRSTRRGMTTVIAGSLAALGAVLGITGAYVGLVAGRLDGLSPVPWADIALIGCGTPAVAVVAAWLLSGREPETLARRPLD
jgi:putative ABC transport system permease protein